MNERQFEYDVFLLHDKENNEEVRFWALTLKNAGLNVWFSEWAMQPIRTLDVYLKQSRTLLLFLPSADSERWPEFETIMLAFRDPLDRHRRFLPAILRNSSSPASLKDCLPIDLASQSDKTTIKLLVDACKPQPLPDSTAVYSTRRLQAGPRDTIQLGAMPRATAFSTANNLLCTALGSDIKFAAFSFASDNSRGALETETVASLPAPPDHLVLGQNDNLIIAASRRQIFSVSISGAPAKITEISVSKSGFSSLALLGECIAAGQRDGTIRVWPFGVEGQAITLRGHNAAVTSVSLYGASLLSASEDRTVRQWDATTGRCLRVLEGHTSGVTTVALNFDGSRAISGALDGSIRIWDLSTGMCARVLSGHTDGISALAYSPDAKFFASAATDRTVRVWDLRTGLCVAVLDGHPTDVRKLGWVGNFNVHAVDSLELKRWNLKDVITSSNLIQTSAATGTTPKDQILYTNAKVLLVGESGAGKTGLSKRLASDIWETSSSTIGAWATQWKLPLENTSGSNQEIEREIWLWDFGGQADQRLIHQLYMDETALIALVFDGQKADIFENLSQWDNDLKRASKSGFGKLLVAGRIDASPVRASQTNLTSFLHERGYAAIFETSAKTGQGCRELKSAIIDGINWDRIPWRSSPRLFKLLKEEIVNLKDEGRILIRFNDLREMLSLKLHGRAERFSDPQLKSVLSLLAGPGVISELAFGGWILFQPQLINAYAQAVLRTMLEDKSELGCILEGDVLAGRLSFHDFDRVEATEEKFILLEMNHTLLERGICSREMTDQGPLLVFPSYYKRLRPELKGHPAILVSYTFEGFAPEIYSTLVVRLHHTDAFKRDGLWQDAADFKSTDGLQIGIKLSKPKDDVYTLEVYADPSMLLGNKIIFIRYVHEHLRVRAENVKRNRHYTCTNCGHALADIGASSMRLEKGLADIGCPACDFRILLQDEIEKMYSSRQITLDVQGLEDMVSTELDNESKERILVGEVISAVAQAGQICREKNVSDHGIDAEIEFRNFAGEATGQIVYLQLKSGDSYLRTSADGKDYFTIRKRRHSQYWMDHNSLVMLVIRTTTGGIQWMEIGQYLRDLYRKRRVEAKGWGRDPDDEETLPMQIEFNGEAFNTQSILKLRARSVQANRSGRATVPRTPKSDSRKIR